MPEKLFDLISFIGAIQGVLLSAFLFDRKGKYPAPFFLASYVLLFSIGLLEPFANRTISGSLRIPLLSFLGSSNFLYGPLLFLFVYNMKSGEPVFEKKQLLHVIPFVVVFAFELSLSYAKLPLADHDVFRLFAFETLVIQILAYNVSAINILKNNDLAEKPGAAGIRWLRSLLVFITGIYVLSFIISHLLLFGWGPAHRFYLLVQLSITVMIYLMTYRLILQPHVFLLPSSSMGEGSNGNGTTKYLRSGLKDEQAGQYIELLHRYMTQEKPYLDPDLSIYTLSQKLNISRNHLTQIINEKLNKNFYEFINGYRVDEVKKMMQDARYSHLNLTGIGLEAGFKSKTAFNINFKKIAGCTPTEWKKMQAQQPTP